MGVLISLPIGIIRTIVNVTQKYVLRQNRPLRIDLPLPFIPIDLVLVTDAAQLLTIARNPDADRLHAFPTEKLPNWVQWYFSGTRFHNKSHDKWFLPFEPKNESAQYEERREVLVQRLSQGFQDADVKKLADQLTRNESEEAIAVTVTQIVNTRFMSEQAKGSIGPEVVGESRKMLQTNILDALVPGRQKDGEKAQESTFAFCLQNAEAGLNTADATHNIANAASPLVLAVMKLKENVDTPIDLLFTRKDNCPTPSVPRLLTKESTLNGLLSYPGRPSSTIILLSISSAAEQSSSLFFTFGSGSEFRVCPFKGFFYDFMTALQAELKGRQKKTLPVTDG